MDKWACPQHIIFSSQETEENENFLPTPTYLSIIMGYVVICFVL